MKIIAAFCGNYCSHSKEGTRWEEIWRKEMGLRVYSICRHNYGHYIGYVNMPNANAVDCSWIPIPLNEYPEYNRCEMAMWQVCRMLNSGNYSAFPDKEFVKEFLSEWD